MARPVFYSFHYEPDNWRASQVRNMGVVDGNEPAKDHDWETITKGGEAAIKKWIDGQLSGRTCTAVLIGAETQNRKWINYEIVKSWDDGKGVFGVYIHRLKNSLGQQTIKGGNPFDSITLGGTTTKLSSVVKVYDPPTSDSKEVYTYINDNFSDWVETAIKNRK
jgi:hypothetical protein